MTAWNVIPDGDLDAESPITESLMTRIRDNEKATNENDASVPDAELQLGEGMRTNAADGLILVSSGGRWVVGGTAQNEVLTSTSTSIALDTVSTWMVSAEYRVGSSSNPVNSIIGTVVNGTLLQLPGSGNFTLIGNVIAFGAVNISSSFITAIKVK